MRGLRPDCKPKITCRDGLSRGGQELDVGVGDKLAFGQDSLHWRAYEGVCEEDIGRGFVKSERRVSDSQKMGGLVVLQNDDIFLAREGRDFSQGHEDPSIVHLRASSGLKYFFVAKTRVKQVNEDASMWSEGMNGTMNGIVGDFVAFDGSGMEFAESEIYREHKNRKKKPHKKKQRLLQQTDTAKRTLGTASRRVHKQVRPQLVIVHCYCVITIRQLFLTPGRQRWRKPKILASDRNRSIF